MMETIVSMVKIFLFVISFCVEIIYLAVIFIHFADGMIFYDDEIVYFAAKNLRWKHFHGDNHLIW